jgi:aspartyl-tRNA(Asn)/glutamyl-tRNA(Gln) amidotransferase subunit B
MSDKSVSSLSDRYEAVIGLEVHCQLATKTKAFCSCSTEFGKPANENVCPICLGMPGTLPVFNEEVLASVVAIGLATHCTIAPKSFFARKNYFYPDLPKGYQISQSDIPFCSNGYVEVDMPDGTKTHVRLLRIHAEEDAGKSIHDIGQETYVDLNRCGVPLIEIVGQPDIRSAHEASLYLQKLRQMVRYLGISDGNMEEGSLRCDANVSIRLKGEAAYGTRTEIKNMNSFKNVEKAIEFELARQEKVIESGGRVVQETVLWDADRSETRPMRSKEFAHDYRYFPEPDLVPIHITTDYIAAVKAKLPEFPDDRRNRFISDYKIPKYDADVLTVDRNVADYFENVVKISSDGKASSNWVMGEVMRVMKEKNLEIAQFPVEAERLGSLITLVGKGSISNTIAKKVFETMMTDAATPEKIVERDGLAQVSDTSAIEKVIDDVLAASPAQLTQYKSGKANLYGYFVGETMKKMAGKANPKIINEILKKKLDSVSV